MFWYYLSFWCRKTQAFYAEKGSSFGTISVFGVGKPGTGSVFSCACFGTISVFGVGKQSKQSNELSHGFGTISVFGVGKLATLERR